MSPRSAPHQGPAMTRERSSTRTPSSASGRFGMTLTITDYMWAPKWPPNRFSIIEGLGSPPERGSPRTTTLGAPRRSRGAPRYPLGYYDLVTTLREALSRRIL